MFIRCPGSQVTWDGQGPAHQSKPAIDARSATVGPVEGEDEAFAKVRCRAQVPDVRTLSPKAWHIGNSRLHEERAIGGAHGMVPDYGSGGERRDSLVDTSYRTNEKSSRLGRKDGSLGTPEDPHFTYAWGSSLGLSPRDRYVEGIRAGPLGFWPDSGAVYCRYRTINEGRIPGSPHPECTQESGALH